MNVKLLRSVQTILAIIGGTIGKFFGGWDGFMYTLILFITVDYITGVIGAAHKKSLCSKVGFVGIKRKVVIILLVAVANAVDMFVLQSKGILRTAVIFFYISNEGISIIENAGVIGLPIPQKLKNVLEQIKEKTDE